ncbi:Protein YicC [Mucinivorans hirudinis]|uniref:Protein YicC n=1 Tax=Mucinivorans hirudinis TaxID=1433126 RepID=A0A060R9B6_9BACT|nr:Protein YicC [Mucinivorans hirudinis]
MVKSMTGYGRGEAQTDGRKITVEIKSLNGKQLDFSIRIPSLYREKEYEIRNVVARSLNRGKVDMTVNYENLQATPRGGSINMELFESYYNQIVEAAKTLGINAEGEKMIPTLLRMPEVMQNEVVATPAQELEAVMRATEEALGAINEFREQEGAVLMADLLARVSMIEELMSRVAPYEAERIETVKGRISNNLEKINVSIDNNRFEQEIIYYLEKFDITEEKVRLKHHCDYFREVAAQSEGGGRKLGFIAQEMGREINTMGSKANHADIQKIVVEMKDELEKIKEQLLNIL